MDIFMPMGTTTRHSNLVSTIYGRLLALLEKKEVYVLQEVCDLVYWGTKNESNGFRLVDVAEIQDTDHFKEITINELEVVRPDFVLFKSNPFMTNRRQTKTAGQPDLIVEVWSESNTKFDKDFKMNLYATSVITEHWYIEQDSNNVQCYMGKEQLPDQYLTNVLITKRGIKFDLRYLAV